ncbi:MAG: winged helix DNA-binding domain-containing protein [Eggerthellaceae bacterium]
MGDGLVQPRAGLCRKMPSACCTGKTLVQAWSLRGAPVVFPAAESAAFLSALVPAKGEPWAYTKGIGLALDALGMEFDRLLELLVRAMPRLDDEAIASKVALDQTLADWVEPLLPANKRARGDSRRCTAAPTSRRYIAVSFCCARARSWASSCSASAPAQRTFTSYRRWTGGALAGRWRRRASGAEVRPLLQAGRAGAHRPDGAGRAGAHVEGHCDSWSRWSSAARGMGAGVRPRCVASVAHRSARCYCLRPRSLFDQRDRATLQATFRCGVSGRPLRTPASSCATGGRARGRPEGCGPSVSLATWLPARAEAARLAEAYAAFGV